jgi:aminopeptidase N
MRASSVSAILVLSLIAAGCSQTGPRVPEMRDAEIVVHDLSMTMDPGKHTLECADTMTLPESILDECCLVFFLGDKLSVESVTLAPAGKRLDMQACKGCAAHENRPGFRCYCVGIPKDAPRPVAVTVTYRGEVFDPPKAEQTMRFVIGPTTGGTIQEEGVFLHGGTGFYPDLPGRMGIFNCVCKVPAGWQAVAQGRLEKQETSESGGVFHWRGDIPSDSLTVVAGKYVVSEADADGVRVRTYFFESEKELAAEYLAAAVEYIRHYSKMLGPYPFGQFSIVENFFNTGYGMPSYTLLGKDVVRIVKRHITAGALGHEIVHCWWGNYVFINEEEGNWCEGLTTYCANYCWDEQMKGADWARDYRRNTMLRYSVIVKPESDYPVNKFLGKRTEEDNEIGYGKPSMIFHMVRRLIGDEKFFGALRAVVKSHGGKKAGWSDFRAAFEKASGKDLGEFFDKWLNCAGIPSVSLNGRVSDDGSKAEIKVAQSGCDSFMPLFVDVKVSAGGVEEIHSNLPVTAHNRTLSIPLSGFASAKASEYKVAVDPDYHCMRKLSAEEIPPSLNVTLYSGKGIVVTPGNCGEDEKKAYGAIAAQVAQFRKWPVKKDGEVTDEDLASGSVMILGTPKENSVCAKAAAKMPEGLKLGESAFKVREKDFSAAANGLLVSMRSPFKPGAYVTIFAGLSAEPVKKAGRLLFHYGWDEFMVFENEKVVDRGLLGQQKNSLTLKLSAK